WIISDAIIPALKHRIPSELRSSACLGESSTRMGDLLGCPRVASLFLWYFSIVSGNSMFCLGFTCYMSWTFGVNTVLRGETILREQLERIGKRAGMNVIP